MVKIGKVFVWVFGTPAISIIIGKVGKYNYRLYNMTFDRFEIHTKAELLDKRYYRELTPND